MPARSKAVPGAAAIAELAPDERVVVRTATFALWASVLTMKIALLENFELPLFVMLGSVAYLLARGGARLSLGRATIYLLTCSTLIVMQIFSPGSLGFHIPPLLGVIILYAPFMVIVPIRREVLLIIISRFVWVCAFIAVMVYVGWLFQLAHLKALNIEKFVPEKFLYVHYNYIQPIHWGNRFMKPNGFFMLETSHTSQLLAMGLVMEICLFRRYLLFAFIAAAEMSTFGGTGFVLILLSLPVIAFYLTPRQVLILAVSVPLLIGAASVIGVAHNFASRSTEFDKEGSSGNDRFVRPYRLLAEDATRDNVTALFGIGPGNGGHNGDAAADLITNPPVKAADEFGIPVAIVWMLFVIGCVAGGVVPLCVTVPILIQYTVLNGALLVPIHIVYLYFLAGLYRPAGQATAFAVVNVRKRLSAARLATAGIPG